MMDICLLGCGGMMPLPKRWLTSLVARYNGKSILIDCGEGTQIALKLSGWSFKSIEAICITHYHADHISGLPGLLLSIGNSGREEPLTIFGPAGLTAVVNGLRVIAPELPFEVKVVELSTDINTTLVVGELEIHSIPAEHTLPCLAYSLEIKRAGKFDALKAKALNIPIQYWKRLQSGEKIDENGLKFLPEMVLGAERKGLKVGYCTDTRPILFDNTNDNRNIFREADLLICEGMYGEEDKLDKVIDKKHMLFSEAAKMADNSKVKELWLTHFSPAMDTPEEFIGNAKSIFQNSFVGNDLMFKTLSFEE